MCAAPGATVSAITFDAGVENPQGAENSAVKNTAPFNLTPLRISEKASILLPGLSAKFAGPRAMESIASAVRASDGDARAWLLRPVHCTFQDVNGTPRHIEYRWRLVC